VLPQIWKKKQQFKKKKSKAVQEKTLPSDGCLAVQHLKKAKQQSTVLNFFAEN
jgi:hypothetical protein